MNEVVTWSRCLCFYEVSARFEHFYIIITLPVHLFHLSFKLFFSHTNSHITFGRPVVRIHEEWDDLLIVDEDNLEDKERSDCA